MSLLWRAGSRRATACRLTRTLSISKAFVGKLPHTQVPITPAGRQAVARYWAQLAALRAQARAWRQS